MLSIDVEKGGCVLLWHSKLVGQFSVPGSSLTSWRRVVWAYLLEFFVILLVGVKLWKLRGEERDIEIKSVHMFDDLDTNCKSVVNSAMREIWLSCTAPLGDRRSGQFETNSSSRLVSEAGGAFRWWIWGCSGRHWGLRWMMSLTRHQIGGKQLWPCRWWLTSWAVVPWTGHY